MLPKPRPDKAFEELGLDPASSAAEVKATWRKLAGLHHPDRGGNPVTFTSLRDAYYLAYAWAQEPQECGVCKGSGREMIISGLNSITLNCPICMGSGKA